MDGRTAEEVLTPEGSTPGSVQWSASSALAALADAGLVVCADGEANLGGRAVAGQRIAPTTVHIGFRQDRFTVTCDPDSNAVLAYRLVPLDGGEP